jgi:hypothetical protein
MPDDTAKLMDILYHFLQEMSNSRLASSALTGTIANQIEGVTEKPGEAGFGVRGSRPPLYAAVGGLS